MNPFPHSFIVILCAGLVVFTDIQLAIGQEAQWRGQGRDGHVESFQAPKIWPKKLKKHISRKGFHISGSQKVKKESTLII